MKFYVKQKVFSLKDKFFIKNENQEDVYQVQGKFMSISNKLELMDMSETVKLRSNKKIFSFLPKYFVFDPEGNELATIQKKFAVRPKFLVTKGHKELEVQGSFFAHSFQILDEGKHIASIEKKVFSFGDSYEINIEDETEVELLLFIVIVIDQVIHEQQRRSSHD